MIHTPFRGPVARFRVLSRCAEGRKTIAGNVRVPLTKLSSLREVQPQWKQNFNMSVGDNGGPR